MDLFNTEKIEKLQRYLQRIDRYISRLEDDMSKMHFMYNWWKNKYCTTCLLEKTKCCVSGEIKCRNLECPLNRK